MCNAIFYLEKCSKGWFKVELTILRAKYATKHSLAESSFDENTIVFLKEIRNLLQTSMASICSYVKQSSRNSQVWLWFLLKVFFMDDDCLWIKKLSVYLKIPAAIWKCEKWRFQSSHSEQFRTSRKGLGKLKPKWTS